MTVSTSNSITPNAQAASAPHGKGKQAEAANGFAALLDNLRAQPEGDEVAVDGNTKIIAKGDKADQDTAIVDKPETESSAEKPAGKDADPADPASLAVNAGAQVEKRPVSPEHEAQPARSAQLEVRTVGQDKNLPRLDKASPDDAPADADSTAAALRQASAIKAAAASQADLKAATSIPPSALPALEASAVAQPVVHQTKQLRSLIPEFRVGKSVNGDAKEASAERLTAKGARAEDAPKLDAKTQNFVSTLEASMAITRRLDQANGDQQATPAARPADGASPLPGQLQAGVSLTGMSTAVPTAQLGVNTPLTHPAWAQAMSQQVLSFVKTDQLGTQMAQLRLDPPELGPLKVSISIKDGVASASFVSANAAVRTAVEQALPQLASQLAESGLSLGQSSVGEHEAQEYAQGNDAQGGSQGEGGADVAGGGQGHAVTANAPIARPSQGLLNTYA